LDNPGPGASPITPKSANEANKYTLNQRTGNQSDERPSPSPGAYLPNMDAIMPRAPSAILHVRPSDRTSDVTPGPSDCQISQDLGGLKPTLHIRSGNPASYQTP
jgi:hypothetical protein